MNFNRLFAAFAIALSLASSSCKQGPYDLDEPGYLVPKTVDEDASIPSLAVNGTLLHVLTYGNPTDPVLVVIHGGPGSDSRYLLNCQAFADQGYFVVFYDQRGSGLSRRHAKDSYTIEVMTDDLDAVIAHYKKSPDQKVFLLGHSWGGILASAYINSRPTKVNGAIIAEPGGLVWQDIKDYVGRVQNFKFFSETLNDATYQDQFLSGKENDHNLLDFKFSVWAAADEAEDSPVGNEGPLPFWRNGAVVNSALFELGEKEKPDWTTNLSQFSTKVLFVYSERNKAYGVAHAKHVSSAFPNVELLLVKDAGHDMISFPQGWQNFYTPALHYLNTLK